MGRRRPPRALSELSDREMLTMLTSVIGHLLSVLTGAAHAHAEATKAGRLVDPSIGDDLRDGVLAGRAAWAAASEHLARARGREN